MLKPRYVVKLSSVSSKAKEILKSHKVTRYREDGTCILLVRANSPLYTCISNLIHRELIFLQSLERIQLPWGDTKI
jgi:hypothetical protein